MGSFGYLDQIGRYFPVPKALWYLIYVSCSFGYWDHSELRNYGKAAHDKKSFRRDPASLQPKSQSSVQENRIQIISFYFLGFLLLKMDEYFTIWHVVEKFNK